MTDRRVSFTDLELPLRFAVEGAEPLPATAVELTYARAGGAVAEVRLDVDVAPEVYARIDREQLFGLTADARGPGAAGFAPSGTVRLTLRLAGGELPGLAAAAGDPRAAARMLESAGGGSPLLSAASWLALSVTAATPGADGSLAAGYATGWAAPRRAPDLPMLAIAAEVLEERGWEYEELDDDTALGWPMAGPDASWSSFAVAREDERRFAIYSVLDVRVPAELRAEAAELVARANWGLPVGAWELDMDDGTLRCKTSVDVGGDRLSLELARRLVERNLAVVDACAAAFGGFAARRLSAREAITAVEG